MGRPVVLLLRLLRLLRLRLLRLELLPRLQLLLRLPLGLSSLPACMCASHTCTHAAHAGLDHVPVPALCVRVWLAVLPCVVHVRCRHDGRGLGPGSRHDRVQVRSQVLRSCARAWPCACVHGEA
jgi:hypothetical protein